MPQQMGTMIFNKNKKEQNHCSALSPCATMCLTIEHLNLNFVKINGSNK